MWVRMRVSKENELTQKVSNGHSLYKKSTVHSSAKTYAMPHDARKEIKEKNKSIAIRQIWSHRFIIEPFKCTVWNVYELVRLSHSWNLKRLQTCKKCNFEQISRNSIRSYIVLVLTGECDRRYLSATCANVHCWFYCSFFFVYPVKTNYWPF